MPPKNSIKSYVAHGYYHIYNRGVEKRTIYIDDQDYKTFLYFLKRYLDKNQKIDPVTHLLNTMNLADEIDLLAYCLMPNHFHMLVKQKNLDGISKLMRRVCTNYSMYFNRRYDRIGPLFQGIYKAVLILTDEQLLHVSRYIHRNPLDLQIRVGPSRGINPIEYDYSSYGDYQGVRKTAWVNTSLILDYFGQTTFRLEKKNLSYQQFVETHNVESVANFDSLSIDQESL